MLKFVGYVVILVVVVVGALAFLGRENDPGSDAYLTNVGAQIDRISNPRVQDLVMYRAVLGQGYACGIDKARIVRLMAVTSAAIKALVGESAELESVANDTFSMGGFRQRRGLGSPCPDVEASVQKIERQFAGAMPE